MARLWGALQSTITEAYKTANDLAETKWKEITCTVIDEGETTERRLLDVNVVSADQAVTSIPKGTLVALDTDPTALPTTPLAERKWVEFQNEDLVDAYLCDVTGTNIYKRLEPGQSVRYVAGPNVPHYGKVAAGTADVGVRVIEGK